MLIILGGLPGVGKSTIGRKLAEKLGAVYLRIDSIEQAVKNAYETYRQQEFSVFAEGYMAAYAVAKDNLEIGLTVIADSVNPVEITRSEYRKIAEQANTNFFEIEIICSDKAEHQKRVDSRKPTVEGLKLPTWQDIINREYEAWTTKRLIIDTAEFTINEAVEKIITELKY